MQHLRPYSRPAELKSTFFQDPQINCLYINILEAWFEKPQAVEAVILLDITLMYGENRGRFRIPYSYKKSLIVGGKKKRKRKPDILSGAEYRVELLNCIID